MRLQLQLACAPPGGRDRPRVGQPRVVVHRVLGRTRPRVRPPPRDRRVRPQPDGRPAAPVMLHSPISSIMIIVGSISNAIQRPLKATVSTGLRPTFTRRL